MQIILRVIAIGIEYAYRSLTVLFLSMTKNKKSFIVSVQFWDKLFSKTKSSFSYSAYSISFLPSILAMTLPYLFFFLRDIIPI